ncbi:hypothetical protein GC194_07535 [bacterium]|nr:hypothetical protein [bacterium]
MVYRSLHKKISVAHLFFIGMFSLLSSCGSGTCEPSNQQLLQYEYNTDAYNVELFRMISTTDSAQLGVSILGVAHSDSQCVAQLQLVTDQGCAKGYFEIESAENLKPLCEATGDEWNGKSLTNCRFEPRSDGSNTTLHLLDATIE